ncbi:MAG: glycerol-3-phosphate 1-O-acyltransferase PlsY [Devosia nanyangense]|uniref:Glycerol-3-phosphate acyltransferase n=1 Tax=Devosia nanyangense TaxID=1228055 RepID=A0A933L3R7_9HYPH|nr:glycerol-3-phosphate 1-O-acyltransferase PlsY [Devosia nanyangense]
MIPYILAALIGYGLGSIPFGLLITQAAGLGDVRNIGSGNIGATNVLRTGRRELAALTLLLDAAKGAVAVLIVRAFVVGHAVPAIEADGGWILCTAGAAAFLGHLFPVWLGFKGGKGVAVFIGVLLGLSWPVGLIFCAVWLVIALAQKYSSLAALTAAVTAPIFGYVLDGQRLAVTAAVLAALLIYTHRANIGRLLDGSEPRIGAEKKEPAP